MHNTETLKPVGRRLLAKRLTAETMSRGGILLPESSQETQRVAEVIALGTNDDAPVALKQRILISAYGGVEVGAKDDGYVIVNYDDIFAIYPKENYGPADIDPMCPVEAAAKRPGYERFPFPASLAAQPFEGVEPKAAVAASLPTWKGTQLVTFFDDNTRTEIELGLVARSDSDGYLDGVLVSHIKLPEGVSNDDPKADELLARAQAFVAQEYRTTTVDTEKGGLVLHERVSGGVGDPNQPEQWDHSAFDNIPEKFYSGAELQPHQIRVILERDELIVKRDALKKFFGTPLFAGLVQDEKDLLEHQHSLMISYADILQQRINQF